MTELDAFFEFVGESIRDINKDIETLYSNNTGNRRRILDHLSSEVLMLDNYVKFLRTSNLLKNRTPDNPAAVRTFTLEELSKFNGKNGNPAYVAVNGMVYDVTNSAAWAAATHFGQGAGNDLTGAFFSCHGSADILNKLPWVGNLI